MIVYGTIKTLHQIPLIIYNENFVVHIYIFFFFILHESR